MCQAPTRSKISFQHRSGFLDVVRCHGSGPRSGEGGRGFGSGEDTRGDCVAAAGACTAYGAGGEGVAAGPQPGRNQIPEVAVEVVATVVVRRSMLDPAHLAVDEELHAGDLRCRQFRIREPAHPEGQHTFPVEGRSDFERLAFAGGGCCGDCNSEDE